MYSVETTGHSLIPKLVMTFLAAIAVATIGLAVGSIIPPILMIPLIILELVLLLLVVFSRKAKRFGYGIMYTFMFISGATLYPTIAYYVSAIGASEVLKAFIISIIAFTGTAIYAAKTKADFSFLGGFLMMGLFALIAFIVVGIFIPFSGPMNMMIAAGGILIFIGFTIYDINKIARHGITEQEIPITVINIYLDFINLFLSILRFFGSDD